MQRNNDLKTRLGKYHKELLERVPVGKALLVLDQLIEGPANLYELDKAIEGISQPHILNLLRKFEKDGLVTAEHKDVGKRPRIYYSITEKGILDYYLGGGLDLDNEDAFFEREIPRLKNHPVFKSELWQLVLSKYPHLAYHYLAMHGRYIEYISPAERAGVMAMTITDGDLVQHVIRAQQEYVKNPGQFKRNGADFTIVDVLKTNAFLHELCDIAYDGIFSRAAIKEGRMQIESRRKEIKEWEKLIEELTKDVGTTDLAG